MVDLKTFNADGIDEGHWRSELLSALSRSDRKSEHSFDAQDTERLVEVLIKAIPQIMTFGMLFPDVDEIKPLKKHLESLILAADAICRAMPNHPILYDSAMWASSELQANKFRGYHMDFEMIHDYARRVAPSRGRIEPPHKRTPSSPIMMTNSESFLILSCRNM